MACVYFFALSYMHTGKTSLSGEKDIRADMKGLFERKIRSKVTDETFSIKCDIFCEA